MEKKTLIAWLLLTLLSYAPSPFGAPAQLKSVKFETVAQGSRLIFDFSAEPTYRVSAGKNPKRLQIDFENISLAAPLARPPASHPLIARLVPIAGKSKNSPRILLDLKRPSVHKVYVTRRKGSARVVLELTSPAAPVRADKTKASKGPVKSANSSRDARAQKSAVKPVSPQGGSSRDDLKPVRILKPGPARERVVVIDAGHGGKDTGAIGPNGTYEKDVVLAIARKLEQMIRAERGMRAVMVRSDDRFVDLRERAELARKVKADLFISLHADAYVNNDVKGSSVFTLSEHGASSEAARWLADRENAALVGGAQLKGKDKLLASILLDLSQNAMLEASNRAAAKVLGELKKDFHLHHRDVQKAGFAVLKSPDVPSMLVETAFISNPDEERNLRDPKHQNLVARAIFDGIRNYFSELRPMIPVDLRVADAQKAAEADGKKPVVKK
ncbi:N-acetylmuramoyl-L-alanine amidase [Methylocaldum marinum]|uniref:N-acetylmuramoyl-L-alanine amidase AmiC n=1 Tax=Methylocaldum marinum TaxID=1432792 RepID=A0A286P3P5_9GAMM|nr:N-acetylmuramoyl-L-alanine amidase [Methylocaldum marinum]BBA32267.1 N-acetylmuramoyl-L-alanine amidase [Methylocaldum marinum]